MSLMTPYSLPKRAVAQAFNQAAMSYDAAADLQRTVAKKLLATYLKNIPTDAMVLDIGTGTGYLMELLAQCITHDRCFGVDIAESMLHVAQQRLNQNIHCQWVCADADHLPFKNECFHILFSNLALQWFSQWKPLFSECHRVLAPKGQFIFSVLGPKTLFELRQSWSVVDEATHVNQFFAGTAWESALTQAGFCLEDMVISTIQLYYPTVLALARQLKALGAHNVNQGRVRGLVGRCKWQRLLAAYEQFRQPAMGLPTSYEVIYIAARKL